jgi:mRNA interferase RelE/StbE
MAWRVELTATAARQLRKLDAATGRRILEFLTKIEGRTNPRSTGKALQGSGPEVLWRYRVGDYRLICNLDDKALLILVVKIGHRSRIYRR